MVTIDMEKTGKKIKEIRKRSGMTIRQVQEACGISAAAVCKWQNGQAMPTLDNLIILADLWDVKMDDLIVERWTEAPCAAGSIPARPINGRYANW